MNNSLALRGEIVLETGDGQQIVKLPLDGVAEEFFDEDTLDDAGVWAEKYVEAKFVRVLRSMIRAHVQRVRMAASRDRLDRPYSPYGDWEPPDPDVWAGTEQRAAEIHDGLIDM